MSINQVEQFTNALERVRNLVYGFLVFTLSLWLPGMAMLGATTVAISWVEENMTFVEERVVSGLAGEQLADSLSANITVTRGRR